MIGGVVALLPFLGFPRMGEAVFQVIAGLAIIGVSTWASIDKKLSQKAKAQMRQMRKVVPEGEGATPLHPHGRRISDFYPKTGQPGRRASDIGGLKDQEPPVDLRAEDSTN